MVSRGAEIYVACLSRPPLRCPTRTRRSHTEGLIGGLFSAFLQVVCILPEGIFSLVLRLLCRPFGSALLMHLVATLDQMETGEDLEAVAHSPDVRTAVPSSLSLELFDTRWARLVHCLSARFMGRAHCLPCVVLRVTVADHVCK